MENGPSGVTMSPGVASPVVNSGATSMEGGVSQVTSRGIAKPVSISSFREAKIKQSGPESTKRSEPNNKSEVVEGKVIEAAERFSKPRKTDGEVADEIFETAKKDGVDSAFEELANLEKKRAIESEEKESSNSRHSGLDPESHNEILNPADAKALADRQVQDDKKTQVLDNRHNDDRQEPKFRDQKDESENKGEKKNVDKVAVSEKHQITEVADPLELKIRALEAKVAELSAQNKDLSKKAEAMQEMARNGMTTALELAKALNELIEQEDEEKKKKNQSLLALLAKLIAQMLIMMTVPDEQMDEALEGTEEASEKAQQAA